MLGGGGGNVTFHGIYSFPRDSYIVNISMHVQVVIVISCQMFAGALDAPP